MINQHPNGETQPGFNERVARLEASVEHLTGDVRELRTDFRELRTELREFRTEVRDEFMRIRTVDFRILFGSIIVSTLGIMGIVAKGFGWI